MIKSAFSFSSSYFLAFFIKSQLWLMSQIIPENIFILGRITKKETSLRLVLQFILSLVSAKRKKRYKSFEYCENKCSSVRQGYIFWPFPPKFRPNCPTGKNLKEDMKKGREKAGKEEKKKRLIKHTLKYLYEA